MLTKKDYYLVSIIGFCVAVFSVPIIKNVDLKFLQINWTTFFILAISLVAVSNLALFIASLINERIKIALQVAKFVAVGGFNTLLDWSVLGLLIYLIGFSSGLYYFLFKSVSFIIANFFAYFWNKYWTFQSEKKSDSKEYVSFLIVSVIGLLINASVAYLIVENFSEASSVTPEQLAIIGAAVATVISLVWNFIGYKIFVFKK